MIDQRFFRRAGPYPLAFIAAQIQGVLSHPDRGETLASDIASPDCAGEQEICGFSDVRFRDLCVQSAALAVITSPKLAEYLPGRVLLIAPDPRLAYAQVCRLYYPRPLAKPCIDPGAHIAASAQIGEGCRIDAGAVVAAGAVLGAGCHICSGAVIEEGVVLGDGCRIGANVSLSHALLGARVAIESGTSIGGAGFGFVPSSEGLMHLPQLGRVLIGNDVEIGNNCSIDRGAMGDTVIGDGTKIDNLVHLAHNVRIGRFCIITAQVGIAGSSTVGDGTMIGGQAAIADHVHVGARVRIVAQSGIIRDIPDGETVGGSPALPVREWHRQTVALARLTGIKPGGNH